MIREAIVKLAAGGSLDQTEAAAAMEEIMAGEATPAQIAAFVTALRFKGETVDEIAGLARVMRLRALHVATPHAVVDTCGTGGDQSDSINVSTTAAFVVAGAGVKVAKHGNRAMSSKSGSSDVLSILGVNMAASPAQQRKALDEAGICFLFAQAHHGAMKHVSPIRQQLGFRTIFNLLGPLTNPAGAKRQVIGVSDPGYLETMAGALARLGSESALIVSAEDGLDELSVSAPTRVVELRNGRIDSFSLTPEEAGLERAPSDTLAQGDPEENAELTRAVLTGKADGVERSLVLLNAGAALYVGGAADSIGAGVTQAGEAIDSGAAAELLDRYVTKTKELAPA